MKKIAFYFLAIVGLASLMWACGEPSDGSLNMSWAAGEVVSIVVCAVALWAAAKLQPRNK